MTVAWANDIRVNLTLPILRLGIGPFAIDPIERLVGAPIADLLALLMRGPVEVRRPSAGPLVEVYPLRLPEGEGVSLALAQLGEFGLANRAGQLELIVPRLAARWVRAQLGSAVMDASPDACADGRTVLFLVQVRGGAQAAWPLGSLGEIGLEVPA